MKDKKLDINNKHLENGVIFVDINSAYIDETVKIGKGTKIYPCTVIEGDTVIGENCIVGMCSHIVDSKIGDQVVIENSVIKESIVGNGTNIGPFAYLRPNSNVGCDCKIGDFVEVKNSNFGDGSKASHLTYIGDSDVGKGVNLGCGVVFVNYDGKNKNRSIIEDGAFVGCNTNIVAPVKIGEKAYVGAGSTVTTDVESKALFVSRSKGKTFEGWVDRKGILDKK